MYSCNTGYRLIGNSSRTCQNGEWNGEEPTCISKYVKDILSRVCLIFIVQLYEGSNGILSLMIRCTSPTF